MSIVGTPVRVKPGADDAVATPLAARRHNRALEIRLFIGGLALLDVVALALAILGANLLRAALEPILPVTNLAADRYVLISLAAIPLLIGLFYLNSLYDFGQILAGTDEYARALHGVTYGVFIVLTLSFFAGADPVVSRSWLVLVWVSSALAVGAARFAARRIVRALRRRGFLRTRVVVGGASTYGVAIAEHLRSAANEGVDVVGFLDEYIPMGHRLSGDLAVLGRPGDLALSRSAAVADEYILVPQALPYQRVEELTRLMVTRQSPTVRIAVSSLDMLTNGVAVVDRGSVPLVRLQSARIAGIDALLKRLVDVVGSLAGIVLTAPLVLADVALALARHRGPVFRAERIHGKGGRPVAIWLLAESRLAPRILRGLPSLVAVLIGRLSLVGPRPVPVDDPTHQNGHLSLTSVRPGLTGPWRITDVHASLAEQARLDLTYVRNYSVWEDLRILWGTLLRALRPSTDEAIIRWGAVESRNPLI